MTELAGLTGLTAAKRSRTEIILSPRNSVIMSTRSPLTDSPWLWLSLFTGAGLILLLLTGGKFGERQAQVERKGQAQEAVASGMTVEEDATGRKTAVDAPDYSRPGQVKIHLVPLASVVAFLFAASVAMFVRERIREKEPLINADER